MHAMKVVTAALKDVYVVTKPKPARTYFALHDMTKLSCVSQTMVVAFTQEEHARSWARSLEDFHEKHGRFPSREYVRKTKELTWVRATAEAPQELEVTKMPLREVLGMLLGSGMHITVVEDPQDLRKASVVTMRFDKAATCARLERALKV